MMNQAEVFVQHYRNLSNPNKELSSAANEYINKLSQSDESFQIARCLLENECDLDVKFIACQLMYRRIREHQPADMKPYLLQLLQRDLPPIAIYQVCASLAVIIVNDETLWNGIIDDLITLMQNKLIIGLNILSEIATYSREAVPKKTQMRLRQCLASVNLFNIFQSVLVVQDIQIVIAGIKCIESWVEFQLQILDNTILTTQLMSLLIQAVNNKVHQFTRIIYDLLYTTLCNSEYAQQVSISEPSFSNLTLIFKTLIQIYSESIDKNYAILVNKFACDYKPIFASQESEYEVTQLMLAIICHPQRRISYQAFQFWILNKQHLPMYGHQILQTVMDKCRLKSLKVTKEFMQGQPEEDDSDSNQGVLNTMDYREHARDIFYTIFSTAPDSNFRLQYFQILNLNMRIESYENQLQILQTETAVFAAQSIMDDIQIENYGPQIQQITNFILQLTSERTDIIAKTALQLFNEFGVQYKFQQELFNSVVTYVMKYIIHPKLGSLAAAAFDAISLQVLSIDENVIQQLINFFAASWSQLESQSQIENFVSGILNLASLSQNQQIFIRLLTIIDEQFRMLNSQMTEQEIFNRIYLVLAPLSWFNLHLEQLPEQIKILATQLCNSIAQPLLSQIGLMNIECLEQVLRLFRVVIRVCDTQSSIDIIQAILDLSLTVFLRDPIKNSDWLQLFTNLLSRSDIRLNQWFALNFQRIHQTSIEYYIRWQDPDLFRHYISLLGEVIRQIPSIILNELPQLIVIILEALTKINNYELNREVLHFLKFFSTQKELSQLFSFIIIQLYGYVPFCNPALLTQIQHITMNISRSLDSDTLQNCINQGLLFSVQKDPNQLLLLSRAIVHICLHTELGTLNRNLKLLLTNLNPQNQEGINVMQLELILANTQIIK